MVGIVDGDSKCEKKKYTLKWTPTLIIEKLERLQLLVKVWCSARLWLIEFCTLDPGSGGWFSKLKYRYIYLEATNWRLSQQTKYTGRLILFKVNIWSRLLNLRGRVTPSIRKWLNSTIIVIGETKLFLIQVTHNYFHLCLYLWF